MKRLTNCYVERRVVSERTKRASRYVHDAHPDVVRRVLDCADAVAADWDGESTASRDAVVVPLRRRLEAAGVWSQFPDVLAGAVEAAGESLSATPVAGPPYVTVTSRGPLLRATLADGRLLVSFPVFEVARGDSTRSLSDARRGASRYVRGATEPGDAVRVDLK